MPIFEYKCSTCQQKFEEFIQGNREQRVLSPCCSSISRRTLRLFRGSFRMGGFRRVDTAQLEKAKKHGDLDQGVPFGQVPGDEQYIDSRGLKPGDDGYLGPLP